MSLTLHWRAPTQLPHSSSMQPGGSPHAASILPWRRPNASSTQPPHSQNAAPTLLQPPPRHCTDPVIPHATVRSSNSIHTTSTPLRATFMHQWGLATSATWSDERGCGMEKRGVIWRREREEGSGGLENVCGVMEKRSWRSETAQQYKSWALVHWWAKCPHKMAEELQRFYPAEIEPKSTGSLPLSHGFLLIFWTYIVTLNQFLNAELSF